MCMLLFLFWLFIYLFQPPNAPSTASEETTDGSDVIGMKCRAPLLQVTVVM